MAAVVADACASSRLRGGGGGGEGTGVGRRRGWGLGRGEKSSVWVGPGWGWDLGWGGVEDIFILGLNRNREYFHASARQPKIVFARSQGARSMPMN